MKDKLTLRKLVRQLIKEAGEADLSHTETLKTAFGGFESVQKSGYDWSVGIYKSTWGPAYEGTKAAEKLAAKNNDPVFENIIKHANFIYDLEATLSSINNQCDGILTGLDGYYGESLAIDITIADEYAVDRLLTAVNWFVEEIGKTIGSAYMTASEGSLGGKQKIQKKLSKHLTLGSKASDSLENISKFIKVADSIPIGQVYNDLVKKESKWFSTMKNKYSDYPLLDQADQLLVMLKTAKEECKPKLDQIYEASLNIEKLLDQIEEISKTQDEINKEEEAAASE